MIYDSNSHKNSDDIFLDRSQKSMMGKAKFTSNDNMQQLLLSSKYIPKAFHNDVDVTFTKIDDKDLTDSCVECGSECHQLYVKRNGCICNIKWCSDYECIQQLMVLTKFLDHCSVCYDAQVEMSNEQQEIHEEILRINQNLIVLSGHTTLLEIILEKNAFFFNFKNQFAEFNNEQMLNAPTIVIEAGRFCHVCYENSNPDEMLECVKCGRFNYHQSCLKLNVEELIPN